MTGGIETGGGGTETGGCGTGGTETGGGGTEIGGTVTGGIGTVTGGTETGGTETRDRWGRDRRGRDRRGRDRRDARTRLNRARASTQGCRLACDRVRRGAAVLPTVLSTRSAARVPVRILCARSVLSGIRRSGEDAREQGRVGRRHGRRLRHRDYLPALACRSWWNDRDRDPRTQNDCGRCSGRLERHSRTLYLERDPLELAKQANREKREPGESPRPGDLGRGDRLDPRLLEPLAQRPPCTEEEGFHCCVRQIHPGCDLRVGEPLDLTQEENLLMGRTQRGDGVPQLVQLWTLLFGRHLRELVIQLDLAWPTGESPVPSPRGVLGDAKKPGPWLLGRVTTPQSSVRIKKRVLSDLLRVGPVPDVSKDEAVHLRQVSSVETLERAVVGMPPQRLKAGGHGRSLPKNPEFLTLRRPASFPSLPGSKSRGPGFA